MSEATFLPPGDIASFKEVLKSSRHVIAVAGAGLSAASGIPTFRGTGGMWRKYDAMSLATPQAFKKNPSLTWQFYHYRREVARSAMPNAAHMALASLSLPNVRHRIAPNSTFTLITQNVDGLSQRALDRAVATANASHPSQVTADDQPRLLEMHGRLFDVMCTSESCSYTEFKLDSPVCPALAGTEEQTEAGVLDPHIPESDLPHCSKCDALARPGVVWFGEIPHHMDIISGIVDKADLCLVYPAAMYASLVQENGGKVAVFNLDRSQGDEDADFLFLGPCEDTLPKALGLSD